MKNLDSVSATIAQECVFGEAPSHSVAAHAQVIYFANCH
jgi:hypothetical protein